MLNNPWMKIKKFKYESKTLKKIYSLKMSRCNIHPVSSSENAVRIFEETASEGYPIVQEDRFSDYLSINIGEVKLILEQSYEGARGRIFPNTLTMETVLEDGITVTYKRDYVVLALRSPDVYLYTRPISEVTDRVILVSTSRDANSIQELGIFQDVIRMGENESGLPQYQARYINTDLIPLSIDYPCLYEYFSNNPFIEHPMEED